MGWDNSRPVPWQRLMREWVIYAGIMSAIFLVVFRSSNISGAIAGVLISGPLYLAFGAVMAKLGHSRKTLKQLRAESKAGNENRRGRDKSDSASDVESDRQSSTGPAGDTNRTRPAPTSRTLGGSNRPKPSSKRKR